MDVDVVVEDDEVVFSLVGVALAGTGGKADFESKAGADVGRAVDVDDVVELDEEETFLGGKAAFFVALLLLLLLAPALADDKDFVRSGRSGGALLSPFSLLLSL